jgi:hypothetical protein
VEALYQVAGLFEGLVVPTFLQDHFQLNDFTPFHDEIRKVDDDLLIGKYVTTLPPAVSSLIGNSSLGLFHAEADGRFGFYYILTRAAEKELATNSVLKPFLDVQLPDGVGMTFDETMDGWYFEGQATPAPGRDGDLTITARNTPGVPTCVFDGRMIIRDVNDFVDGYEHEAAIEGTISFGAFEGQGQSTFAIDSSASRFHYLRTNAATGETEMRYHINFATHDGREFTFDGVKYMQRDTKGGVRNIAEILQDYTTLYCHVYENAPGAQREIGTALLRFRTFENLAAVSNLAGFLTSFQITGTGDPAIQLQARLRFLAFTGQFVQREYDPLGFGTAVSGAVG